MKDLEAERFFADLQEHIENVTTFYIPTDELERVMVAMHASGHGALPRRSGAGNDLQTVAAPWAIDRERACMCGHLGKQHSAHSVCTSPACRCTAFTPESTDSEADRG